MASSQYLPGILKIIQEDDLTPECKDLISTLPTKPWLTTLYQYKGCWLPSIPIQGFLSCKTHFQAHDSDIFVVTMPKSGTTWIKALTFAIVYRKLYSDYSQHPLLTNNSHDLVPFLEYIDAARLTPFSHHPRIFGSHFSYDFIAEVIKDSNCKIVFQCRNPKDALISLWQYENKIVHQIDDESFLLEDTFERYCRGSIIFGPPSDQVLGYWKQSLQRSDKVMFLKYEDMKQEVDVHVRKLAQFLGCPFSLEEESQGVVDKIIKLCSFDNMRNLDVNKNGKLATLTKVNNNSYFRKGEVGDWKNYFTSDMTKKMDSIYEKTYHTFGLRF